MCLGQGEEDKDGYGWMDGDIALGGGFWVCVRLESRGQRENQRQQDSPSRFRALSKIADRGFSREPIKGRR